MTATEKYHAVLEGKMKEGEFVRQMRQAFPQYITQWNGYKDSVAILKQKQMIFEKKEVKKDITKLADSFPIEAIERGIDMELESAGIDSTGAVSKDEYMKAKRTAVTNLQKDANHYLNLSSGESAKVDKNDKMKETKRGKLEADTFNAMKKATLKEEVDFSLDPYEDKKEIVRQVIDLVKREKSVPTSVAVDFVKTHYEDILNAHDDQAILDEFEEFFSVNYESGSDYNEVMGVNRKGEKQPETDGSTAAKYKRAAKGLEEVEEAVNAYTPGDMFSTDFDYEGMLKAGLKVRINTPVDVMQKIYDSFEDVNYHRENAHLGNVIDAIKEGDKGAALDALKSFRREIKNTMSDIFEGAFPVRERDESYVPRNGVVKERVATLDNFISLIQDKAGDSGFPEEEEAMEVIEAIADHYGIKIQIGGLVGEEKAKKDHDGDGEVESKEDEYKGVKDKAIKKAMGKKDEMVKENLKAIISKVLEEGAINEAATQELARIADDYAGFEGMKGAILDLQNLVSDIEAYYDKTREKIQKVYNTLGEIRNEEGLKVGGFLAPAIETAFMKDLRPVTKQGFTKGLDQPKVRVISQKDIDQHNSGERPLGETEMDPPKQTVYTPNI